MGWQDAERIPDFAQTLCNGSALSGEPAERLQAVAATGGVTIAYDHAHFRCQQAVEGFARRASGTLDVLVQPVDMNPKQVTKCDCLYDITMTVNAPMGQVVLTLYRRWDNLGRSASQPNEPVQVAGTTLEVP